jgi:hypothetical protein
MKRFLALVALLLAVLVPAGAQSPKPHHRRHRIHKTHHRKAVAPKSIRVWVNTKSGVYHYPGMRWYGNTQEGEYMTEAEARKRGYRPTQNGQ